MRRVSTVVSCAIWILVIGCQPPPTMSLDATVGFDAQPDSGSGDAIPPDAEVSPPADAPLFACTWEELQPIGECAVANCSEVGLDPTALAACIGENCYVLLLGVSSGCRKCLTAGLSGSIEELVASCTSISLGR